MFFAPDIGGRRTLADLIAQKIEEKQQEEQQSQQMDPKVIKVYTSVGGILHQYVSCASFWLHVVIVLENSLRPSRLFLLWATGRRYVSLFAHFTNFISWIGSLDYRAW